MTKEEIQNLRDKNPDAWYMKWSDEELKWVLYTVDEYKEFVENRSFIDYDGHGYAFVNEKATKITTYPSIINQLPENTTHIAWFNK